MPKTLLAFDEKQKQLVHSYLATTVAYMMGRKFEEGDWADVYCRAKEIPNEGWSNLGIDVSHDGLGVEHKMLCLRSKKSMLDHCGDRLMHPSATRSIRISNVDGNATEVARDVLRQYAELIEERRKAVAVNSPNGQSDMRTGWLLWQESLEEFLYFEEEMLPPIPENYWAEWKESGGGRRKKSKNLWVYENDSGIKRYSITTSAGSKIQPYFDVPPPNDPNINHFCVQGEYISPTEVRIWVTKNTESLIIQAFGGTDQSVLDRAIADSQLDQIGEEDGISNTIELAAVQVHLSKDSYLKLKASFGGKSDEHLMQLFLNWQAQANGQ